MSNNTDDKVKATPQAVIKPVKKTTDKAAVKDTNKTTAKTIEKTVAKRLSKGQRTHIRRMKKEAHDAGKEYRPEII